MIHIPGMEIAMISGMKNLHPKKVSCSVFKVE
jgi:hypothetical protein